MNRAVVENYTGMGEPPYCAITFSAAGTKEERDDLLFDLTIKGVKSSPIKIERSLATHPSQPQIKKLHSTATPDADSPRQTKTPHSSKPLSAKVETDG